MVAAQRLATISATDDHDVVLQTSPLDHTDDDCTGPALAVVRLEHPVGGDESPGVMRRLTKAFDGSQLGKQSLCVDLGPARTAHTAYREPRSLTSPSMIQSVGVAEM